MGLKGYFFSLDAFLAALLVIIAVVLINSNFETTQETKKIQFSSQDQMQILSELKISEINNPYVSQLIASGDITKFNNTILEQIGDFYASNKSDKAKYLFVNVTSGYFAENTGVMLLIDDNVLYSTVKSKNDSVYISKKLISGIAVDKPTEGFITKVYISGIDGRETNTFVYFGGFEGEGNLTKKIILPNNIYLKNGYMELDASENFTFWINGINQGLFAVNKTNIIRPDTWNFSINNLSSGTNTVTLNFTTGKGYVAGGYIKITYESNSTDSSIIYGNVTTKTERLPGIKGFINLYSSIFADGKIQSMRIYLHYYANKSLYLTLGNKTVYNSTNSTGEQIIDLQNINITQKLNYSNISNETIPLRLGIIGLNYTVTVTVGNVDIVLVNDDSGSMEECAINGCSMSSQSSTTYCQTTATYTPQLGAFCNYRTENYTLPVYGAVCSGRYHANCSPGELRRIDILRNATLSFVDVVLNTTGNRLGLVEYSDNTNTVIPNGSTWSNRFAPFPNGIVGMQNLTNSKALLKNHTINYTDSFFGTCICCGIIKANNMINSMGNQTRKKALVVMSDGYANDRCYGGGGSSSGDAIRAADEACDDNISVFAVGFGADVDVSTLSQIPCNNGSYFNATNVSDLVQVYTQIATQISTISFISQQVNSTITGNFSSTLYDDSFIEINYTPNIEYTFGYIPIKEESDRFGNNITSGTFQIPAGAILSSAEVISYSAEKWTDNLTIVNSQNRQLFKLKKYGNTFQLLGDPFIVNAPANVFENNNTIFISTAISPTNRTGGSEYDKIVYEYLIKVSGNATSVTPYSDGCIWNLTFYDGSSTIILIPENYNGTTQCYFNNGTYNINDGMQQAAYDLLKNFDFNSDGSLDVKISQSTIQIDSIKITNVPSLWGPTVVELRVWQ